MVLWLATPLSPDRMGIVEADKPLAVWAVKRQRIVKPVRLLRCHGNARHVEAHPIPTGWIDDQDLAVEVEQCVEGRVARLRHTM